LKKLNFTLALFLTLWLVLSLPAITFAATPPEAPTLISPVNGVAVNSTSVTFQWSASSGATNYWLAVTKASDNSVVINKAVGNVTSDTETGFPNNGSVYKWVVAAGNSAGWSSAYSQWTFTNGVTLPTVPNLTSPGNGASVIGTSVTFQWSPSSGATNYWLSVYGAGNYLINKAVGNVNSDTEVGFPNNGTTYIWMVAAGNGAGWTSASTARTFVNGSVVPMAPSIISPTNNAQVAGTSVTFQWSASSGATNYWLAVTKASDNSVVINKAVGNVTSDTETGFPNDATVYNWFVAAGNSAGWSSASRTTFINGIVSLPPAPVLVSPPDGANLSGTSVTFQWNASSGATNYWLAVTRVSNNSVVITKAVGNVTSDTETGFPNDGTAYKWVVAAGNKAGWSSASTTRTFTNGPPITIPPSPTLTSPADGANVSDTPITFQWAASSGATNYWLAVVKASDNSVIINKAVGNATSYVETSFPNNGTTYRWVVAAGNSAGWSNASTARTFTNGTLPNIWSTTGSLTSPRVTHTATLLPNGKVLVAGGGDASGYVTYSCELYDPQTGTWTATGSMVKMRGSHKAILLPSGMVLVAGGNDDHISGSGYVLNSCELYNPDTGTWSTTGSLNHARWHFTMTLLSNGKVLAASGGDYYGPVSACELYDPAAGTWSYTGSESVPRFEPTATLLANGKVLTVGGINGIYAVNSCELYDPVSGTWTTTGSTSNVLYGHTATLLPNNKVLVTGGMNINNPNYDTSSAISACQLFDPNTGTWSSTGSMSKARAYHLASLLPNGKVLVAGGGGINYLNTSELYNPADGTWSNASNMNLARKMGTATLLNNGTLLVAGGANNSGVFTSSVELYGLQTLSWVSLPSGTAQDLRGVWGSSSSDVYAVGNQGTILHYDGNSWSPMTSGTGQNLLSVWGTSSSDVFTVGAIGTILHYNGNSWSMMNSGTSVGLWGIWGNSFSNVYVVGDAGTILHYNGSTWSPINSNTSYYLRSIWGRSPSNIYAVGQNFYVGTILHYDGNTWATLNNFNIGFSSIYGTSDSNIFAAGGNGVTCTILKFDGNSWNPTWSGPINQGAGIIWGNSAANVFAVGGIILHYDGINWNEMKTDVGLAAIWGSQDGYVFAVGAGGSILQLK
jgi:hypothetical protein